MTARLPPTPGQTVGPFFGSALPYPGGPELVPPSHQLAIRLHGVVRDGAGQPVPDAMIELWQPGSDGAVIERAGSLVRSGWDFTGWGRSATDQQGHYAFTTIRPGPNDQGFPPYFALTVFARGLLDRLYTRAYLDLPNHLPDHVRPLLVATPDDAGLRFDITLQGENQTPFLAIESPHPEG